MKEEVKEEEVREGGVREGEEGEGEEKKREDNRQSPWGSYKSMLGKALSESYSSISCEKYRNKNNYGFQEGKRKKGEKKN